MNSADRSSPLPFVFLFLLLSSARSTSHEAATKLHGNYKGCFSKVYSFGGSETDTGNAHFLGILPDDTSARGVGNSTSRLSNGRLVVDFLCEALSLPLLSPYKRPSADTSHGLNFAVAGSTPLSAGFLMKTGCKGNNASSRSCKADMEKSLFWIGDTGVSDYINALRSSIPLRDLADTSVRSVCKLLKTLLDNGAKHIVVQGLPPVGCFPVYTSSNPQQRHDHMGCVATANIGISNHNQILQHKLKRLHKLYPNSSILYADYWNAYLTILTNPKKHHIEETFKPCCSCEGQFTFGSTCTSICKNPQNFISWDGVHLTEAMNKNLADLFLNQGFCRPSFNELIRSKRIM